MQNNTQFASQISQLKVDAYTFQQKAEQQTFSNMLGIGNLLATMSQEERLTSQFSDNLNLQKQQLERSTQNDIANIALEYGLSIEEGETLESITEKAQPFASAEQKARLNKLLKDNEDTNTEIDLSARIEEFMTVPDENGNVMSASEASEVTLAYMESIGLKPNAKDLARFQIQANNIQTRLDAEKRAREANQKLQVAETEKSIGFWDNVNNFFSQSKSSTNSQGQDFGEWLQETGDIKDTVDSTAKFFTGLLNK